MSTELIGPGDRYRVAIVALSSAGGDIYTRHRATAGIAQAEAGTYRVLVGEACAVTLTLGENGLTLRSVKLLNAADALITADVTAGGGAPDWLPTDSSYRLFEGDRKTPAPERYIPLEGLTGERPTAGDGELTSLDRLAVAVGRSVARANATLARGQADTGVALIAAVTLRVAIEQADVGQGRVLVTLARPGKAEEKGQYVELTMKTVPGQKSTEECDG